MKPKAKRVLITILTFVTGLVSGLVAEKYRPLVAASGETAQVIVEAIPEKPLEKGAHVVDSDAK